MSEMDKKLIAEKQNSSPTRKRKRKRQQHKKEEVVIENKIEKSNKKLEHSTKNNQIKNTKKNTSNTAEKKTDKSNIKDKNSKKIKTTLEQRKASNQIKQKKKIVIVIIIIALVLFISLFCQMYKINQNKKQEEIINNKINDIKEHYNKYVITNKAADIYIVKNNKYLKSGKIGINQELTLEEINIIPKSGYFKITTFKEEYYIYYKNVNIIENLTENNQRYKNYIVFNNNIITKDITNIYNENNELVYQFKTSFEFPIIINKKNLYGIEFNNKLLYIKKEDVKQIIDSNNTKLTNTKGIAVLNYHFFYDETKRSERNDCNQVICHSKSGFKKHLEYIKNNNIFTPTMNEFEMYLNNEINLPKSVLITIDDGWRTTIAEELLNKYQLNGTIFLITSWFKEINWLNNYEYIEYHSHGDNLHNQGVCPGGQGGAIKCKDKESLLKDLAISREKLAGTTAFCYPFYEYNNYSISVLKEAGFTLAFAGGFKKATQNSNKYQIPRFVMYDYTTVNELASYIN